jgi:hypothetical protein
MIALRCIIMIDVERPLLAQSGRSYANGIP